MNVFLSQIPAQNNSIAGSPSVKVPSYKDFL